MYEFIYQLHDAFVKAGLADPWQETVHVCDILANGALRGLDDQSLQSLTSKKLHIDEIIEQRKQGRPLAYILQQTVFMGRPFTCTPATLIPRAETELLVRAVLAHKAILSAKEPIIIDVGTGSGNIAISLALGLPQSRVFALDISPEAVAQAQKHVERYRLQGCVTVCCGDMFAPLQDLGLENQVDAVVCNPPYIPSGSLSKMAAEIVEHEPLVALDAGPYGINIFRRLLQDASHFLRPYGLLAFEFGVGQEMLVQRLLEKSGGYGQSRLIADRSGQPRVFVAQKIGPSAAV